MVRIKAKIINHRSVYTKNEEQKILYFLKLKNGKKVKYWHTVKDHHPHFWSDRPEQELVSENINFKVKPVDGHPEKIMIELHDDPKYTVDIRKVLKNLGYRTYYDSTPYKRRYLIDNGIYTDIELENFDDSQLSRNILADGEIYPSEKVFNFRDCIYDIECYDMHRFPIPLGEDGTINSGDPITGIGFSPMDKDEYFIITWFEDENESKKYKWDNETTIIQVPSEQIMLDKFFSLGEKSIDVQGGWNTKKFDYPYMTARDQNNNFKWNMFFHDLDMLDVFRKTRVRGIPSSALDYIGDLFYDMPKVKLDHPISWYWENDRDKFFEYLKRDLYITKRIEKDRRLMRNTITFAEMVGLPLSKVHGRYTPGDTLIQRRMPDNTFYYPVKRPNVKKKGGIQFDPVPGVYGISILIDFTSLYNRVMQTFNIDQQMLIRKSMNYNGNIVKTPYGTKFKADKRGVMPSELANLEKERNKVKAKMFQYSPGSVKYESYYGEQFNLKTGLLSIPGALGFKDGYYYDPHLYNSTTQSAAYHMLITPKFIKRKYGLETLYGHTDSCKLETKCQTVEEAVEFGKELVRDLNDFYFRNLEQFNIPEEWRVIEMKLEKVYDSLVIGKKKSRNAGLVAWEEGQWIEREGDDLKRLDVTGFPLVNYSWPEILQKVMQKMLIFILNGKNRKQCEGFFSLFKKNLFKGEYDHLLLISKKLGKEIEEYANKNLQHIRAAIKLGNVTGRKLMKGEKVRYWITKGNIPIPEEMGIPSEIDYRYYINHLIDPPIENLLNIAFGSRHLSVQKLLKVGA